MLTDNLDTIQSVIYFDMDILLTLHLPTSLELFNHYLGIH